jgi:hypothetical protein
MRKTILRRRERESFEIPPLPVRLSGQDLRGGLARVGLSMLKPGERIIDGRIYYSSAWLDAHDLPHLAGWEPGTTKEDTMLDVTIKTTIDSEEPCDFLATIIGTAVREALEAQALELADTGITVIVGQRAAKAHIFKVAEPV